MMERTVNKREVRNPFIHLISSRILTSRSVQRSAFKDTFEEKHRMERLLSVRGVSYIDDTGAQSVNAIWYSLESVNTPLILIVQDIHNVEELLLLKSLFRLKVKKIITLKKNKKLEQIFASVVNDICYSRGMNMAVREAYNSAEKGDVVLFSSGVPVQVERVSRRFKEAVRRL